MDSLIHWSLPYIMAILVIGVSGFISKINFLYMAGLILLWTSTLTVLGVGISAEKLFLFLILIHMILYYLRKPGILMPYFIPYFLLMSCLIIYSITMSFQVPPNNLSALMPTSLQLPPSRGIFSSILFFCSILVVHFSFPKHTYRQNLYIILRVMFGSAVIVIFIFMSQLFLSVISPSMNSFFALLSSNNATESVILVEEGISSGGFFGIRPALFSSEPKYFGLAFANIAVFALLQRNIRLPYLANWIASPIFIFTCFFCLIMSSSVTAIFSFLIGFSGILILSTPRKKKIQSRVINAFLFLISVGAVSILITSDSFVFQRIEMYIQLFQAGFTGDSLDANLSTTGYILWLIDDPSKLFFGVGFGNGAFYAYDYISITSGFSINGFTSSRVPIIDLISSVGIFGTSLIYILWFKWLSYIDKWSKKLPLADSKQLVFIRGCIIYYLFAGMLYPANIHIWLFFGLAFSFIYNSRNQILLNTQTSSKSSSV